MAKQWNNYASTVYSVVYNCSVQYEENANYIGTSREDFGVQIGLLSQWLHYYEGERREITMEQDKKNGDISGLLLILILLWTVDSCLYQEQSMYRLWSIRRCVQCTWKPFTGWTPLLQLKGGGKFQVHCAIYNSNLLK